MTTEHTPGPWAAQEEDEFMGCVFIPIETDQPTGPLCRLICEVHPADQDEGLTDTDRANAHLIAAAPELLELAYQYLSDLRYPMDEDSRRRRIERAEAVIAKATGRKPQEEKSLPDDGEDDGYPGKCSNPGGHSWVVSDETDRSYCEYCGADGDA